MVPVGVARYGHMATATGTGHHYKLRYVRQVGRRRRPARAAAAEPESTLSSHCAENAYQVRVEL